MGKREFKLVPRSTSHLPNEHMFIVDMLTDYWWRALKRISNSITVSRCVSGWCQQLLSLLPLLGGSSWHICHITDRDDPCVFLFWQSGVPGFLTDMQKACSNYSNYCQKKWMQQTGHRLTLKGFDELYFYCFSFGMFYDQIVSDCGMMWAATSCCSMLFAQACACVARFKRLVWNQFCSIVLY